MKKNAFYIVLILLLNSCHSYSKPFLIKSYGDSVTSKGKVLVAYATRAGSTIEVADSIALTIAQQGYWVDLKHIETVDKLEDYSAVIIGSAIRMGNVTPEVKKFVERRKIELEKIPTAYFVVCLTLKDDTPENREKVTEYLAPLRTLVTPFAEGYFAGKMDYSKLKRIDRFIAKHVAKAPEGDFRDWEKIKAWIIDFRL